MQTNDSDNTGNDNKAITQEKAENSDLGKAPDQASQSDPPQPKQQHQSKKENKIQEKLEQKIKLVQQQHGESVECRKAILDKNELENSVPVTLTYSIEKEDRQNKTKVELLEFFKQGLQFKKNFKTEMKRYVEKPMRVDRIWGQWIIRNLNRQKKIATPFPRPQDCRCDPDVIRHMHDAGFPTREEAERTYEKLVQQLERLLNNYDACIQQVFGKRVSQQDTVVQQEKGIEKSTGNDSGKEATGPYEKTDQETIVLDEKNAGKEATGQEKSIGKDGGQEDDEEKVQENEQDRGKAIFSCKPAQLQQERVQFKGNFKTVFAKQSNNNGNSVNSNEEPEWQQKKQRKYDSSSSSNSWSSSQSSRNRASWQDNQQQQYGQNWNNNSRRRDGNDQQWHLSSTPSKPPQQQPIWTEWSLSLQLNEVLLRKLERQYCGEENERELKIFWLVYCHEVMDFVIKQYQLPPQVMLTMYEKLDVRRELFASPLNSFFKDYCSLFQVDREFGSLGSFYASKEEGVTVRGNYQCNPPHIENVFNESAPEILRLLQEAEDNGHEMLVVYFMPWTDCEAYRLLKGSKFNLEEVVLQEHKHKEYTLLDNFYRKLIIKTYMFVLANSLSRNIWQGQKINAVIRQIVADFEHPDDYKGPSYLY